MIWELAAGEWLQTSTASPIAGVLVYDSGRKRVVQFGAISPNLPSNETWEYDGSTWQRAAIAESPPARCSAAITFDSARSRVVLFGGVANDVYLSDTWVYDGTSWTRVQTATEPPARADAALAYDPLRDRVVLVGGNAASRLADTWEFDGTSWAEVVVDTPDGSYPAATYDPTKRGVLLLKTCPLVFEAPPCEDVLWRYRWNSAGADEDCSNGVDDDGDRAVDCADPDCEALRCNGGRCASGACR